MTRLAPRTLSLGLVLLAAGGCFALTMGVRQSMGLFLGPINTHTGLASASIPPKPSPVNLSRSGS